MRLQLVREGQQYLTRQGVLITVVDVIEGYPNYVCFEVGGILSYMNLETFNRQVHQLVNESCLLATAEYKEDLIKNKIEFKYNHGEIWQGKDDKQYLILRTLRSSKSRFVLYPIRTDWDYDIEDLPTSDEVELVARLTYHQPVKFGCAQVLIKDSIWDVQEPQFHTVTIRSAEVLDACELPDELTVGFGNIIAYYPTALDYEDYRELVWACNDSKDPNVLSCLEELETKLLENRWLVEPDWLPN
nr:MAG TPA: hypothetical protein [Caudoviricetes sp.]